MHNLGTSFIGHLPHLILLIALVVGFTWLWIKRRHEREEQRERESTNTVPNSDPPVVMRVVAKRALFALIPIILAVITAVIIYVIVLTNQRPGAFIIWLHVGVSVLALVLIIFKLTKVGRKGFRKGLIPNQLLTAGASLFLIAFSVPLIGTGIVLIFQPGGFSFIAYAHLVTGAWWLVLLIWHLRRYFVVSVRTVFSWR